MKKRIRILQGFMAVFLVMCLLIPVGIAFAEDYGRTSTVLSDAGLVVGDTYQRHTFIAEGLHWVFYATDDEIVYTSSADATTWATPTKFDDYTCNISPSDDCCNGSSFALWYDAVANYVDVAWMNRTGANENIYYVMGTPVANGTITWGTKYTAVPADLNLTYSHPSICDNTADYPFIAYMVYNGSSYSGNVSSSSTNTGAWTLSTNGSLSSSISLNISTDVLYPSVVPVSAGNVSVMVAFDNGGVDYRLAQNYLQYNVSTDQWAYPATVQFPLPATSYIDAAFLAYHSEVAWSGNLTTPDDVFVVATVNDSLLGKYYFFDRYGAPVSPFSSDIALNTGWYVGSLGIRNALGDMTVTAIEIQNKTTLWNDDYNMTTKTWDGFVELTGLDATSGTQTQSDYDNAGTDDLGAIYYDKMVAFIPDLEYGCYGCPAVVTPATIPASVTTMAWIVVLVFGALICLVLLAYGASEAIKGGSTEFVKIGAIGLITLIIAATIVAELL